MPHRVYVPSGKSDPGALPAIVGACLGVAVLAGAALGFVALWFDLLLIFPMCLGGLVGAVAASMVNKRRVRRPLAVLCIGVASGLLAQTLVHAVAYERARSLIADSLAADTDMQDFVRDNGIDRAVDLALAGEEGSSPLVGYLHIAAKNGITITHAGTSSSSSPTLTGYGVYALWAIEFLIVGGLAGWLPASAANEPFCETCQHWYDLRHIVGRGAGTSHAVKNTIDRLKMGHLGEAVAELGASDGKSASLLVVRRCARCVDADALLEVTRVTGIGKKAQNKTRFAMLLRPSELDELAPGASRPTA